MESLSETPFRVYRYEQLKPTYLGAADDVALGTLLLDMKHAGKFDGAKVGIMYRPVDDQPGEWLVNPWA